MSLYTRNAVNLISIIVTISIFFILNQIDFSKINLEKINFKKELEISNNIQEIANENIISNSDEENIPKENIIQENSYEYDWYINIPIIELIAPIEETVEKEVMNRSVGHFEHTSKWDGNIGLGAHNRGYKVNYFANIKKLKKGDIINYCYKGRERQYLVSNIVIIKDTDWSYLEATEENKITLITCVENEPNYRRCIQGTEKIN